MQILLAAIGILGSSQMEVGVNWSGKGAVGYEMDPDDVVANVSHYIAGLAAETGSQSPRTQRATDS